MDALNRWLDSAAATPAGSILMFLFVFLARIAIDSWQRKRAERSAHRKTKRV